MIKAKYVVVNGIGSNEIIYCDSDESAAVRALGEGGREMYKVCFNQGNHELSIERFIHLSGDKNPGGSIRIHRNVLDALLGNFTPVSSGGVIGKGGVGL